MGIHLTKIRSDKNKKEKKEGSSVEKRTWRLDWGRYRRINWHINR